MSSLDPRSNLKPSEIAVEFDRMWEMWARGIQYGDDVLKDTGRDER